MKILLDIDGVLITTPAWRAVEVHLDGFLQFNPRAESELARMILATNATIVLTSTHRISYSCEDWKRIFHGRGIAVSQVEKVNDCASLDQMPARVLEIMEWIDLSAKDERYIIIDDDLSLGGLPMAIKANWIQTKPLIGLNQECADAGIAILLSREIPA